MFATIPVDNSEAILSRDNEAKFILKESSSHICQGAQSFSGFDALCHKFET
jgi:hypothetical protein